MRITPSRYFLLFMKREERSEERQPKGGQQKNKMGEGLTLTPYVCGFRKSRKSMARLAPHLGQKSWSFALVLNW